jgi:hypothetical protein
MKNTGAGPVPVPNQITVALTVTQHARTNSTRKANASLLSLLFTHNRISQNEDQTKIHFYIYKAHNLTNSRTSFAYFVISHPSRLLNLPSWVLST